MNIKETIEKYYLVKEKQKELQTKLDKYKEIIENYMKNEGVKKIKVEDYVVKKTQIKNERMNKKDCPSDIWEKYKISATYTTIEVKKGKEDKDKLEKKEKIRKSV